MREERQKELSGVGIASIIIMYFVPTFTRDLTKFHQIFIVVMQKGEKMTDDTINRQMAIKAIEDLQDCYNGFSDTYDKACIIGVLEELPSAQSEPIRCKDCKHYNSGFECLIEGYGIERDKDWFCGSAERKEE